MEGDKHFTSATLMALQATIESYLVQLFGDSNLCHVTFILPETSREHIITLPQDHQYHTKRLCLKCIYT